MFRLPGKVPRSWSVVVKGTWCYSAYYYIENMGSKSQTDLGLKSTSNIY